MREWNNKKNRNKFNSFVRKLIIRNIKDKLYEHKYKLTFIATTIYVGVLYKVLHYINSRNNKLISTSPNEHVEFKIINITIEYEISRILDYCMTYDITNKIKYKTMEIYIDIEGRYNSAPDILELRIPINQYRETVLNSFLKEIRGIGCMFVFENNRWICSGDVKKSEHTDIIGKEFEQLWYDCIQYHKNGKDNMHILLNGPSGSGKSMFVRAYVWYTQKPLYIVDKRGINPNTIPPNSVVLIQDPLISNNYGVISKLVSNKKHTVFVCVSDTKHLEISSSRFQRVVNIRRTDDNLKSLFLRTYRHCDVRKELLETMAKKFCKEVNKKYPNNTLTLSDASSMMMKHKNDPTNFIHNLNKLMIY